MSTLDVHGTTWWKNSELVEIGKFSKYEHVWNVFETTKFAAGFKTSIQEISNGRTHVSRTPKPQCRNLPTPRGPLKIGPNLNFGMEDAHLTFMMVFFPFLP